jgi:hypothetical protein
VTVTDGFDLVRGKSEWLVSGIQNYIIVAKGVIFVESHLLNAEVSEDAKLAPLTMISGWIGDGRF